MDRAVKLAGVLWRVALAALLTLGAWQAYNLRNAPAWAQAQIQREADATRGAALTAIADTRRDVLAEVARARQDTRQEVAALRQDVLGPDGLKKDLLARVDGGMEMARQAVQDAAQRADARLLDLTAKLDAQVAGMRSDAQPLVKSTGRVLDAAAEQADLLGRCATEDPETGELIGNPDCLANRLIPAMKAGERVATVIAAETPGTAKAVREFAQQGAGIAADIHTATSAFVAPTPWYKKLAGGLWDALAMASRIF